MEKEERCGLEEEKRKAVKEEMKIVKDYITIEVND